MSDYSSLDVTLIRRNPEMPAARLRVKEMAAAARKKAAKFWDFIAALISLTGLAKPLVEDCCWEMIDGGDITLDSQFRVTLRS